MNRYAADTSKEHLRPMLIRLGDATLADDLCEHFRRSDFTAELVGSSMIEVSRPDAPSAEQERREIEMHLSVWRAMHPEAGIEAIG